MTQDRRLTSQAGMEANDVQVETPQNEDQEQNENNTETSKVLSGYAIDWNTPSKDLVGFK